MGKEKEEGVETPYELWCPCVCGHTMESHYPNALNMKWHCVDRSIKDPMWSCGCRDFTLDNLKYLEGLYQFNER